MRLNKHNEKKISKPMIKKYTGFKTKLWKKPNEYEHQN